MQLLVLMLGVLALTQADFITISLYPGEKFDETCAPNTYLYIQTAGWRSSQTRCRIGGDRRINVKEMCEGKTSCEFYVNHPEIYHECPGDGVDSLQVEYECRECSSESLLDHERHRRVGGIDVTKFCGFDYGSPVTTRRPMPIMCPNRAFERKHVCRDCTPTDNKGIVRFVERVDRLRAIYNWTDTDDNAVFMPWDQQIEYDHDMIHNLRTCVFRNFGIKFNCKRTDKWKCKRVNDIVKATHYLDSGHYIPIEDVHGHSELRK